MNARISSTVAQGYTSRYIINISKLRPFIFYMTLFPVILFGSTPFCTQRRIDLGCDAGGWARFAIKLRRLYTAYPREPPKDLLLNYALLPYGDLTLTSYNHPNQFLLRAAPCLNSSLYEI